MTQNFTAFLEANGIDFQKDCSIEQSKKNNYDGTDTKILWISSDKFLSTDVAENFLVCSATLASKLASGEVKLRNAQIVIEDGNCGLIMPKNVTVLDATKLW